MNDVAMEEWLTGLGVKWEHHPDFDLSTIDRKASRQNQARLEAIDEDVVDRYALDAKAGAVFPPLLVWQRPRSSPILLGGNHRDAAFEKAGKATHGVYLVFCDASMATRLKYEDNRRHGLTPSTDERCAQAIHLMENEGYTADAAAGVVGVTPARLNLARALLSADLRARAVRIHRFDQVPKSVRARLDAIKSEPVFAEAAALVVTASMNQEAVFSFVTRLNETKTDDTAMKLIAKERALWRGHDRAATSNTKMTSTPRWRAMEACNKLSRCRPVDVSASCTDREQARLLGETLLAGRRQIDAMFAQLQRDFPA